MRWILNIFGVLLALAGTVWILQGTGLYPVGFMANQSKWTYAGIVLDLLAVGLFVLANRQRKQPPSA